MSDYEKTKTAVVGIVPTGEEGELGEPQAALVVLRGAKLGETFTLAEKTLVGRNPDAEIHLTDHGVSWDHCRINVEDGDVWLEDLGSTNGTYLNNQRLVEGRLLAEGDRIRVGSAVILKFDWLDAVEQSYQQEMLDSTMRDGLTGLYNKRYLQERMVGELSYSIRHTVPLSVCMLDLDHFKRINDEHGHLAGDAVLKIFAQIMKDSTRAEDVCCRFGGEEFAIISRGTNAEQAMVMAERVRSAVARREFKWGGERLPITVSCGIATVSATTDDTPEEILAAADEALYDAKNAGRNQVKVYPFE